MTTIQGRTACEHCGRRLNEPVSLAVAERMPCPHYASTGRALSLQTNELFAVADGVSRQLRRNIGLILSGKRKRPAFEMKEGDSYWKAGRESVYRRIVVDRVCKRYSELVRRYNGPIIKDCEESIKEHQGHGSDKIKKK